jgi:hypothetical protein
MESTTKFIASLPAWFVGAIFIISLLIAIVYPNEIMLLLIFDFIWVYAIGIEVNRAFKINISVNYFKAAIIYVGISSAVTALFIPKNVPFYLTLPHLFCAGYSCYFVAKSIRSFELKRMAKLGDFSNYFFLLWVFPTGVWFIQPKIKNIVTGNLPNEKIKPVFETCPRCLKKMDISTFLEEKEWPAFGLQFNIGKKLKEYDLITCSFCKTKFRTDKARLFFGLLKPMQLYWFLVAYIGFFILMAILVFLDGMGIIKFNDFVRVHLF